MPEQPKTKAAPPRRGGIDLKNLDWGVILPIGALHVIAILAFFPTFFSWSGLIMAAVLSWLTACIGITLCFHRLLTHHSFKTPKWFEYVLTLCGCLAWQGSPASWVGTHRLHHKHSDHDHDPHSPQHGFTWAHILWTLHTELEGIRPHDAAKDLLRDRGHALIHRFHWAPQILLAALLFGAGWLIGGLTLAISWVVWAIAVRTIFVYHVTWFVNSAAHTWGYQNYKKTGEHSTNNWWVALLSFGEGWHNNHHAHPRSAAHGLRWFEVDMTWWMIKLLSWVGLAKNIYCLPPEKLPRAAIAQDRADRAAWAAKAAQATPTNPLSPKPKTMG